MSSQKHKTKDGNVMSFIIQRLDINQIKDESKNMVEICEDCYIKENDFLPRHTVFDYATWC